MARARHKHVLRTRRSIRRRRMVRLGLPVGTVLALASPAVGVVWPHQQRVSDVPVIKPAAVSARTTPVPMQVAPISRSEESVRLVQKTPQVVDHVFTTTELDVRERPSDTARVHDVLHPAEKIAITGRTRGPWAEVVIDQEAYWVHRAYLAPTRPAAPTPAPTPEPAATPSAAAPSPSPASATVAASGLSGAPCPSGSAVENGLVPNAVEVHRAVCAAFPQITTYGGVRPGDPGPHGTGHALDVMVPDATAGQQIADWARAHAAELGITQVIWAQHIWTVQRSSEGWRLMPDRGSVTANHDDHVHVTVS